MTYIRQKHLEKMKINILLSFVLPGIAFFSNLWEGKPDDGIFLAYIFWSFWWGWQLYWPHFKDSVTVPRKGSGFFSFFNWLFWTPYLYFFNFIYYNMLAIIVGILGGGIYKFIKYLQEYKLVLQRRRV